MKLPSSTNRLRSQRGSIVLVLMAFLVMMLMLSAATQQAVRISRDELNLIEKQQIARLAATTNAPPASPKPSNAP
jgi:hypothetical protein